MKHSVHTLIFRSLKRTHDMFISEEGLPIPEDELRYVLLGMSLCDTSLLRAGRIREVLII